MVRALVTPKGGEPVLAIGLTAANFERFASNAPDPKTIDTVVVCVGSTEDDVRDALNGLGLADAKIEFVKAAAPAKPAPPVATNAAVLAAATKLAKGKPAPGKHAKGKQAKKRR